MTRPVRVSLAILGLLIAAGLAASAAWYSGARALRGQIDDWADAQRANGYTIDYAAPRIDGFPLHYRIAAMDAKLGGTTADGTAWQWRGPLVRAEARPWRPSEITVYLPPEQETVFERDGRAVRLPTRMKDGVVRLDLRRSREAMRLDARDVTVSLPADRQAAAESVQIHLVRPEPDPALPPPPTLAVDVRVDRLTLPAGTDNPFGPEVAVLALAADLFGRLPAQATRPALAAWRDSGGRATIHNVTVATGPARIDAEGTVALDETEQPVANLDARIAGHRAILSAMADRGVVARDHVNSIGFVLDLLAKAPAGGGPPVLEVPVKVRGGQLYAGPVPIAPIPPIFWD